MSAIPPPIPTIPMPLPPPDLRPRLRLPAAWVMYCLAPLALAYGARENSADFLGGIFTAAAVSTVLWLAAMAAPLAVLIAETALVLLILSPFLPAAPIAWTAAAAAGGITGGWFSRFRSQEDDYFFMPLVVSMLTFLILASFALNGSWDEAIANVRTEILAGWDFTPERWEQGLKAVQPEMREGLEKLGMEEVKRWTAPLTVFGMALTWSFMTWLGGRMIRLACGRLRWANTSMIFFRIQPRYIFLLIAALLLAILYSLFALELALYMALVLAAPIALAGFFEAASVFAYHLLLRRAAGRWVEVGLIALSGLFILVYFTPATVAMIGLADSWFDFRRLGRLKRQPGPDASA